MAKMQSKIIERYKEENKRVFNKRFGVIFDGEDNLKPVIVENLIDSSPTALQCAWINERFLGGAGFESDLSSIDIGNGILPYSPNNLLFDVCEPLSRHQGVWVHVSYNFNYQKDSFNVVPYSLCKLGEKDSKDYNGKILLSRKGWGKDLKKDQVEIYDVYNPRKEVIQSQVDAAGGWQNYKGQIFYFKLNDKYDYAKSKIETAYTFADTENQLGFFYNGTARRSFEDLTIVRHREFPNKQDKDDFYSNLQKLSGFENASSKLVVQDEWDDEREKTGNFKFDTVKSEVRSDKFAHFENSCSNYIRKVYNIPPQLVDFVAGKLGNTSGEEMKTGQSIYNSIISRDQEKVELFMTELFDNFKEKINPSNNWVIKQYSLLEGGTVNY